MKRVSESAGVYAVEVYSKVTEISRLAIGANSFTALFYRRSDAIEFKRELTTQLANCRLRVVKVIVRIEIIERRVRRTNNERRIQNRI
jgi:hypothetical protein